MGSAYFTNPLVFLIDIVFGLYILAVMLRFMLQWFRADFYNPFAQALIKITNPPLKPLRRFIPGVAGMDMASIVLMLALQMIAVALISFVSGQSLHPAFLFFYSLAELVSLFIMVFVVAIIIQVIVSWVNPGVYNPALSMVYALTEPVLRPARRLIPAVGGLDLSPLVATVALYLLKMLVYPPIVALGQMLSQ